MSSLEPHSYSKQWRRIVFNPITIKELRATFRQRRFLIVYWVSLALYSLFVLWLAAIEVGQDTTKTGEPVGQKLFNYCAAAQLALMIFVLPGFAATAVTDERENQSFDLLVTTALRAFDIVWGKFLACMSYAFLFLSATFPLVCVSILFTGVRPGEILFAYIVMSMVAALMTGTGLACSSTGRSSRRAVAVTYALGLFASLGWASLAVWLRGSMPASYGKMNLVGYYYDLVFHSGWSSTIWFGVVPVVLWAIVLALLFISSVDRLKPTTANKSTNLRILGLVLAAVVLVMAITDSWQMAKSRAAVRQDIVWRGLSVVVLESLLLGIFLVGAACEDPRLSRRIQWQYQWASGLKWPLRIVLPGSASGLAYVLLVGLVLLGGSTCSLTLSGLELAKGTNSPAGLSVSYVQAPLGWTALVLGSMVWFYAALGRWCSTIFAGAIYTRTVVIFVFVMANLVPVCLMTLSEVTARDSTAAVLEHPSSLWNIHYASAFLSLRSIGDMTGYWPLPDRGIFRSKLIIQTWGIDQPVAAVSAAFHAGSALVLTGLGAWRQRRVIRPVLRFLHPNLLLTLPRQL